MTSSMTDMTVSNNTFFLWIVFWCHWLCVAIVFWLVTSYFSVFWWQICGWSWRWYVDRVLVVYIPLSAVTMWCLHHAWWSNFVTVEWWFWYSHDCCHAVFTPFPDAGQLCNYYHNASFLSFRSWADGAPCVHGLDLMNVSVLMCTYASPWAMECNCPASAVLCVWPTSIGQSKIRNCTYLCAFVGKVRNGSRLLLAEAMHT